MCAFAGRGATARARNSARGPVVNPLQHGAGGVVHHDVAPRQYPPRDLEEPVPAHAGAARAGPPSTWAFAPTHRGPSSRAPARTSAPLSSTTGPFRTSKTTPGSTAASRSAIAAGSPSTALPGGSGSLSPSKARRSSGSSCSSAGTRSYTPRSTTPGTSIAAAWGWGPSHVAPGPTPHPTVTPPLVSRKAPFGSAGASPRGAKVEEPITAGPGTGRRAATRGTPASANPAR